jgi:hypothetical protein
MMTMTTIKIMMIVKSPPSPPPALLDEAPLAPAVVGDKVVPVVTVMRVTVVNTVVVDVVDTQTVSDDTVGRVCKTEPGEHDETATHCVPPAVLNVRPAVHEVHWRSCVIDGRLVCSIPAPQGGATALQAPLLSLNELPLLQLVHTRSEVSVGGVESSAPAPQTTVKGEQLELLEAAEYVIPSAHDMQLRSVDDDGGADWYRPAEHTTPQGAHATVPGE